VLEVRPQHGGLFLEVFFKDYGWLPLIGNPLRAQASLLEPRSSSRARTCDVAESGRPNLPSSFTQEKSRFFEHARSFVFRVLPIVAGAVARLLLWPLVYKAVAVLAGARGRPAWSGGADRARLRGVAGPPLADFGYRHYTDTPLMFLERSSRTPTTELHGSLLRVLWGTCATTPSDDDALGRGAVALVPAGG